MNTPIKALSLEQLVSLVKELNQPKFRAKQIYEWLYQHHVGSYEAMTNLPASLRAALTERFPLYTPAVVDRQKSADGTCKFLLQYNDGVCVETVAIPSREGDRLTVCFSTQAGCAMDCLFCATGQEGLTRNLLSGEIVDQVLIAQEEMGRRVTNAVGMGQGEPFLNYDNTLAAVRILNDSNAVAIGARHISISTCGIIPGINRFAKEPEQFTLAISLHAASQQTRDMLMPKAAQYNLSELKSSLLDYVEQTKRRVTLEYIMIDGFTDSPEDIDQLCSFCRGLHCHVNLIPINSVSESPFQPSNQQTIDRWLTAVKKFGVETTLRDSRGSDIAGACGQLKNTFSARH